VQLPDLLNRYGDILTYLSIDLVAIFVMTYVLYFRRHWRADLLLSYIALNVGIFVTMSLLTKVRVDIAVGFGLFAILSIIRLRSSAVTQQEVAYYFIALVLGLVNGLGVPDRGLVVALNVVLLLTMLVFDSKLLRDRSRRMDVRLAGVFTNEAALVAELERRLGGQVAYQEITEIDLIHGHMLIDVRLRPGQTAHVGGYDVRYDRPTGAIDTRDGRIEKIVLGIRSAQGAAAFLKSRKMLGKGGHSPTIDPAAIGGLGISLVEE